MAGVAWRRRWAGSGSSTERTLGTDAGAGAGKGNGADTGNMDVLNTL